MIIGSSILNFLYYALFFALPVAVPVFLIVSICMYVYAKRANKKQPGTFSPEQLRTRRIVMIIAAAVSGVLLAVAIGFVILMFLAIAYM